MDGIVAEQRPTWVTADAPLNKLLLLADLQGSNVINRPTSWTRGDARHRPTSQVPVPLTSVGSVSSPQRCLCDAPKPKIYMIAQQQQRWQQFSDKRNGTPSPYYIFFFFCFGPLSFELFSHCTIVWVTKSSLNTHT